MNPRILPALLLALSTTVSSPAIAGIKVTASIKPIHSLVAAVMQGVAEPELLIGAASDPHHVSLKPSQRRAIADADLIVWTGPELEASLVKAIKPSSDKSLALLESDLPDKHNARSSDGIDPHIWLSPANASQIARTVAARLAAIDEANSKTYEKNRDRLINRIDSLAAEMEFELMVPKRSYIAHHDSYQYFEKTFSLEGVGFIRNSHNEDSGFQTISKLSHMIELRTANCIVYDADKVPGIIDSLGKTDDTRYARIPVLGLEFNAGPDLWFDVMKKISRRFRQCLQ